MPVSTGRAKDFKETGQASVKELWPESGLRTGPDVERGDRLPPRDRHPVPLRSTVGDAETVESRAAQGEDVERLGETVRARVRAKSGVTLEWEIIRLGIPREGRPVGEALAETVAS